MKAGLRCATFFFLTLSVLVWGQSPPERFLETLKAAPEGFREVGFLDLTDVQSETHRNGNGVLGAMWTCVPNEKNEYITPYVKLLSIAGRDVRLAEAITIEIGVFNVCTTPIEFPWSPKPVTMGSRRHRQPHAVVRLGIFTEDPQVESTDEVYLYGTDSDPATTRTVHEREFVRIRMKARLTFVRDSSHAELAPPFGNKRTIKLNAFGQYWEHGSNKTKSGWFGPFPAYEMPGDITVTLRPATTNAEQPPKAASAQ